METNEMDKFFAKKNNNNSEPIREYPNLRTVYCPQCGSPEAVPDDFIINNDTIYVCCHDCWCINTHEEKL